MRRPAGLTLIEVLVASVALVLIGAFTVAIYTTGLAANRRSDVQEQAYTAAMMALEHVGRSLQGGKVRLTPDDGVVAELVVDQPVLVDGRLEVDAGGNPVWGEAATLRSAGGRLSSLDPAGTSRLLADLGQGAATFQMVEDNLLEVTVFAEVQGERETASSYLVQRRYYLPNQVP